jgi:hypothetical protein
MLAILIPVNINAIVLVYAVPEDTIQSFTDGLALLLYYHLGLTKINSYNKGLLKSKWILVSDTLLSIFGRSSQQIFLFYESLSYGYTWPWYFVITPLSKWIRFSDVSSNYFFKFRKKISFLTTNKTSEHKRKQTKTNENKLKQTKTRYTIFLYASMIIPNIIGGFIL